MLQEDPAVNAVQNLGDVGGDDDPLNEMANKGGKAGLGCSEKIVETQN